MTSFGPLTSQGSPQYIPRQGEGLRGREEGERARGPRLLHVVAGSSGETPPPNRRSRSAQLKASPLLTRQRPLYSRARQTFPEGLGSMWGRLMIELGWNRGRRSMLDRSRVCGRSGVDPAPKIGPLSSSARRRHLPALTADRPAGRGLLRAPFPPSPPLLGGGGLCPA